LSSTIRALRYSKPPDIRLLRSGRRQTWSLRPGLPLNSHREVTNLWLGKGYGRLMFRLRNLSDMGRWANLGIEGYWHVEP
jgi:hypothetical protein